MTQLGLKRLLSEEATRQMQIELMKKSSMPTREDFDARWKEGYIHSEDLQPLKFHRAQDITYNSNKRLIGMIAGTQGGKTSFGPHWLYKEIKLRNGGDFIAVTSSYDLFKLKMLPSMIAVFEGIYGIGRYWTGDRIIEIKNPDTGEFMAKKVSDRMWARIILRSAEATSGLESSTAKGAWLDEAGQPNFTIDAYRAIRRRLTLNKGRILFTTTLYQLGWLTSEIIDPATDTGNTSFEYVNQAEIEHTISEDANTEIIQFDSILNPLFPIEEYEEMKAKLPDDVFQMQYRGRKAKRRFLIYDCFNREINTCPPFYVSDEWKKFVGVDFGSVHTAAVFCAENPETKQLFIYKEYLDGGKLISGHAQSLLNGLHNFRGAFGGARNEDQWRSEFGKHGFPIQPPETNDVEIGIERVYAQIKLGNVIVFNTCNKLLSEIDKYRRRRNDSGDALEEIENKNDFHMLDSLRYVVATMRRGDTKVKVVKLGGAFKNM